MNRFGNLWNVAKLSLFHPAPPPPPAASLPPSTVLRLGADFSISGVGTHTISGVLPVVAFPVAGALMFFDFLVNVTAGASPLVMRIRRSVAGGPMLTVKDWTLTLPDAAPCSLLLSAAWREFGLDGTAQAFDLEFMVDSATDITVPFLNGTRSQHVLMAYDGGGNTVVMAP